MITETIIATEIINAAEIANLHSVPVINVKIGGINVNALFDTCSSLSLIKKSVVDKMKKVKNYSHDSISLTSISGSKVAISKTCELELKIGEKCFKQKFFVTDSPWAFDCPAIIGIDIMRKLQLAYNPVNETVYQVGDTWSFNTVESHTHSMNNALTMLSCSLMTVDNMYIKPFTAKKIKLKVNWPDNDQLKENEVLYLTPSYYVYNNCAVNMENALVKVVNGCIKTYVQNKSDKEILIPKGKLLATVTKIEEENVCLEEFNCPDCEFIEKFLYKENDIDIEKEADKKVKDLHDQMRILAVIKIQECKKGDCKTYLDMNDPAGKGFDGKLNTYKAKLINSAISKRNMKLRQGLKEERIKLMTEARKKLEDIPDAEIDKNEEFMSRDEKLLAKIDLNHLNEYEKEKFVELVKKHSHAFALNSSEMSSVPNYKHRIDTKDNKPICKKPYRVPLSEIELQKSHIDEYLDANIIKLSESEWSSCCILVKKKDGTSRLCVDYRDLNAITTPDDYPMPNVTEILNQLGGNSYYTCLDCFSGFHSLKIAEEDIDKLAFSTVFGKYTFVRMPFGLRNAPSAFQRVMNTVLKDKTDKKVFVYMDDIIVISQTLEEHLKELGEIFELLYDNGLRLKPSKCDFAKDKLKYLGHIISKEGILPNEDKIKAIRDFPTPENVSDIQSFLGLVGYYRRFIPNCSDYSKSMSNLLKKGVEFIWNDECQKSFEYFKEVLTSDTVLMHPDPNKRFYLATDASDYCGGGVLMQKDDDGYFRPIWYVSKSFTAAQRNYFTTEKELLALLICIEACRCLLYGKAFTVYTDHLALKWFYNFKEPNQRLVRWSHKLRDYDIDVVHRPGKKHQAADCLSRSRKGQVDRIKEVCPNPNVTFSYDEFSEKPIVQVEIDSQPIIAVLKQKSGQAQLEKLLKEREDTKKLEKEFGILTNDSFVIDYTWKDVLKQQRSCEWSAEIINYLEKKNEGILDENIEKPISMKGLNFYLEESGILRLKTENHGRPRVSALDRLVVADPAYQIQLMYLHHDTIFGGHFGTEKTFERIKTSYYWPKMRIDIENYCKSCLICQQFKNKPTAKRSLQRMPTPTRPWQFTSIDLHGPMPPTHKGNVFILVFIDYLTKFVEAIPLPNKEAKTVARCFVDNIITRYSCPEVLLSDLGKEFVAKVFRETCEILGIKRLYTTSYHPQTNGMVERMNRTLSGVLTPFLNDFQNNWDDLLPLALCCIRNSINKTTHETPFHALYSFDARMPFQTMTEPIVKKYDLDTNYTSELLTSLKLMHKNVNESMIKSKEYNEKYRDKTAKNIPFEIGQLVLLYTPTTKIGASPKLTKQNRGPYRIIDKFGSHNFQIRHCGDLDDIQKVHAQRLKPYVSRKPFIAPDLEQTVEVQIIFDSSSSEEDEESEPIYNPITGLPETDDENSEIIVKPKRVKKIMVNKSGITNKSNEGTELSQKTVRTPMSNSKKSVDFDLSQNEIIEFNNENAEIQNLDENNVIKIDQVNQTENVDETDNEPENDFSENDFNDSESKEEDSYTEPDEIYEKSETFRKTLSRDVSLENSSDEETIKNLSERDNEQEFSLIKDDINNSDSDTVSSNPEKDNSEIRTENNDALTGKKLIKIGEKQKDVPVLRDVRDQRPSPGENPHATRSRGAARVVEIEHCLKRNQDAARPEHTDRKLEAMREAKIQPKVKIVFKSQDRVPQIFRVTENVEQKESQNDNGQVSIIEKINEKDNHLEDETEKVTQATNEIEKANNESEPKPESTTEKGLRTVLEYLDSI